MENKELLKEAKKEIGACKDKYTIDESFIRRRLRVGEVRAKKILKDLNTKNQDVTMKRFYYLVSLGIK